jgi:hypothetical protein
MHTAAPMVVADYPKLFAKKLQEYTISLRQIKLA